MSSETVENRLYRSGFGLRIAKKFRNSPTFGREAQPLPHRGSRRKGAKRQDFWKWNKPHEVSSNFSPPLVSVRRPYVRTRSGLPLSRRLSSAKGASVSSDISLIWSDQLVARSEQSQWYKKFLRNYFEALPKRSASLSCTRAKVGNGKS